MKFIEKFRSHPSCGKALFHDLSVAPAADHADICMLLFQGCLHAVPVTAMSVRKNHKIAVITAPDLLHAVCITPAQNPLRACLPGLSGEFLPVFEDCHFHLQHAPDPDHLLADMARPADNQLLLKGNPLTQDLLSLQRTDSVPRQRCGFRQMFRKKTALFRFPKQLSVCQQTFFPCKLRTDHRQNHIQAVPFQAFQNLNQLFHNYLRSLPPDCRHPLRGKQIQVIILPVSYRKHSRITRIHAGTGRCRRFLTARKKDLQHRQGCDHRRCFLRVRKKVLQHRQGCDHRRCFLRVRKKVLQHRQGCDQRSCFLTARQKLPGFHQLIKETESEKTSRDRTNPIPARAESATAQPFLAFIRIPSAFRFLSVRKTLAARIGGVQKLM